MATGNAGGIRAAKAFVEMYVNNAALQKGLKQAESRLRSFQGGIAKITGGMFDWRTMLAGGGSAGFIGKEFATFEQSMARVSTMLEEPEKYMDGFTAGVKRMAQESGKNINELADGLKEILSASVAPEQALGMLNNANRMAVAADTTIGQSVFTLIGIMNSYGMSAAETARISDILFESVKWGTMTVSGLSDAIGTVAPMANAAGMELEDLMAVMSTLTRAGLSADEAGVRVNAMLKQMPREMRNALAVAKRWEGVELADINAVIPEIRAAQGFAILGNNVKGLERDMTMIRDSSGATDQAFKKMANTLMQWFNRVREAVRQVAIAVGEALGPGLKKYGDAAINALRGLVGIINRNRAALVQFVKVTAGIMAVGMALLFVSKMAGLLIFVIGVLEILLHKWLLIPAVVAAVVLHMTGGFAEIKRVSTDAMDGVKKALEGGDVLLAVKIFWTSVKLLWAESVAAIEGVWNSAVVSMAKSDNWIYFLTSQYGIVGELKKMWWEAVRNIKDAFNSIGASIAQIIITSDIGAIGRFFSRDNDSDKMTRQLQEVDKRLAIKTKRNLDEITEKQNQFEQQRIEAVKRLSDANSKLDKQASDEADRRQAEIQRLRAEQAALIAEANRPKAAASVAGAGLPPNGGAQAAAAMSAKIANQIAEARGAFLTGRSFGWGAGGANAKSKELETAEQSRDFLRRIETNTRTGGVIVGA